MSGKLTRPVLPRASPNAAMKSLPVTFEPDVGQVDAGVQYVGRAGGTTILMRSDGIELVAPAGRGRPAEESLKLQFIHRASGGSFANPSTKYAAQSTGSPSAAPKRKRRRRSSSTSHIRKHSGKRRARSRSTPSKQRSGLHTDKPQRPSLPRSSKPKTVQPSSRRITPRADQPTLTWHGEEKLNGETNYFLGNKPDLWRTHVPRFRRAEASNVLPGMDVIAYGNEQALEYDLRFAPEADPREVRLKIMSSDPARIDPSGDLVMQLKGHEVLMKRPVVYEELANTFEAGKRKIVGGAFEMEPDGTIGFRVNAYNHSAMLVIDPSLTMAYSTFLGGAGSDSANAIALDAAGKIYIGGTTSSASTFVESSGTKEGPGGGPSDFFIAKIDPTQSGAESLLYLTFIGGSGDEEGGSIAVDGSGNVAIAGTSTSLDYPVTDSSVLTTAANGSPVNDAAITEIDPTGATLVYSTLFGGNGNEGTLSRGGSPWTLQGIFMW